MEDDCYLHPEFFKKCNNLLNNFNDIKWDILQLGWQPYYYGNAKDIFIIL